MRSQKRIIKKPLKAMKNNGANTMQVMSYLSELINAEIDNRTPEKIPENITINQLYEIAAMSQMQGIIFSALMRLDLSTEYNEKIKQLVMSSAMKSLAQLSLIKEMSKRLEENKISHQVLKGAVLKGVYNNPVYREMGDIDIMIYGEDIKRAEKIALQLGFELKEVVGHHAIYVKKPYLVMEIHWTLFDKQVDKNQYLYYKNSFRAKLADGKSYTYEFEKEDFYVYMVSHMAKHFYETGCGIRNLLDIYVYLEKYKNEIDTDVIAGELSKLGLADFEKHIKKLAYIWILKEECPKFYLDLFDYMLDCGIYGKGENGVWGQLAKESRINNNSIDEKNIKRIYWFPSRERMKEQYPWVEKSILLLPIAWLVRIVKGITKKERIRRYKAIAKDSSKQMEKMLTIYETLNLKFRR